MLLPGKAAVAGAPLAATPLAGTPLPDAGPAAELTRGMAPVETGPTEETTGDTALAWYDAAGAELGGIWAGPAAVGPPEAAETLPGVAGVAAMTVVVAAGVVTMAVLVE